ncbi:hypothetical protein DFH06DRAFT_1141638 [Mycena polygramma]|nr:hypothetical protein DFH06DRAFT_1141638 [Mycena polygramma]
MDQPFDLKQVAQVFNDAVASIRDDTPDMEPQAIAWLKKARYKVICDLKKAYHDLEKSRDAPLLRPAWAVDPSETLYLMTEDLPKLLEPYRQAIGDNVRQLLTDCGFQHFTLVSRHLSMQITFPAQLAQAAPTAGQPRALYIQDEFTASNFGRLIVDARRANSLNDSHAEAGVVHVEHKQEGPEGAEGGDESDGAGVLQSMTSSSLVATLWSNCSNLLLAFTVSCLLGILLGRNV